MCGLLVTLGRDGVLFGDEFVAGGVLSATSVLWTGGRSGCCGGCGVGGVGEFAEVVADGVECPFALSAGDSSEPEMSGVLADFHLAEYGFDDGFASGVVDPAGLGTQPACHPLASGCVFRDRSSRRVGYPFVTPNPPGRYQRVDLGVTKVACRGVDHGDELCNVACLIGDLRRQDYLGVFIDDRLGVVGVMEPVIGFHHPRFRVREIALRPICRCRPGCRRLCSFSNLGVVAAVLGGLASGCLCSPISRFSLDGFLGGTQLDETGLPTGKLRRDPSPRRSSPNASSSARSTASASARI